MFKVFACCVVLALAAIGTAEARPFTARDLAGLERVSDPHLSPDGRFVAYNVRSTDWDANRGVNALWVQDRTAAGAPPPHLGLVVRSNSSWSTSGSSGSAVVRGRPRFDQCATTSRARHER